MVLIAGLLTPGVVALADDAVTLEGGTRLVGEVLEQNDDVVVLEERTLGRVELPRSSVASIEPYEEAKPTEPEAARWRFRVELGLNGSEGNTSALNLTAATRGEYTSLRHRATTSLDYFFGVENGDVSRNDAHFDLNWDRIFPGTPWFFFSQSLVQFDDFQSWTVRVGTFGGPGYTFVDKERFKLIGRVGAGVVQEFEEDDTRPEALAQIDMTWQLTEHQQLRATNRFFPSIEEFFEFRNVTEASWETRFTEWEGLSFRLSVINEYESETPDDTEHNDVKYLASLVYSF